MNLTRQVFEVTDAQNVSQIVENGQFPSLDRRHFWPFICGDRWLLVYFFPCSNTIIHTGTLGLGKFITCLTNLKSFYKLFGVKILSSSLNPVHVSLLPGEEKDPGLQMLIKNDPDLTVCSHLEARLLIFTELLTGVSAHLEFAVKELSNLQSMSCILGQ